MLSVRPVELPQANPASFPYFLPPPGPVGTITSKSDPLTRASDSSPENRRSGAIDSSQLPPLSATNMPYRLSAASTARACGGKPLMSKSRRSRRRSPMRGNAVGQPAREVAGGIDVLAPRPLHGDAKGVVDVAARHFVVADDRRQDRQAGGIRGRPALGSQAIRVQIERRCLRRLPAGVGQTRLPELVKAAARRIDHDQVTIARTLALELRPA